MLPAGCVLTVIENGGLKHFQDLLKNIIIKKGLRNMTFKDHLNHLKFVIDELERQGEKPTSIKIKPEIHQKLKCGLRSSEDITELFGLDVIIDCEAQYDVVVV